MSKRVHFSENVEGAEGDEGPTSSKKRAISPTEEMNCDSKEEDQQEDEDDQDFVFAKEDDEMGELDIRKFRAQEAAEVDEEDGIKFTAFNLEEEMEDGHFDKAGNFIFKKNTDVRDNWLDDIDWSKVKKQANNSAEADKSSSDSDSSSSSEGEGIDRVAVYEKLILLLQPGESVQQGIRRFGGGAGANKNRNKAKKEVISPENKEKMNQLIDLANELVNDGEMDIYQFTFEKMNYLIKAAKKKDNYASIVSGDKDGGESDMFSDTFDAAKPVTKPADESKASETLWEYKWKNSDEEEIHGPFPTAKMIEWQNDAYFDEVFVRKVGSKQFYSSKRVDFDLYD